ncbi:MAG: NUDIX hydrolase [Halobacteriales archaeon]
MTEDPTNTSPAFDDQDPVWPIVESVTEYETGWYTGGYDRVAQPDGTHKRYYWANLPAAVVVVAVDDDDVVFVEQYRPTVRRSFLELPAGIVEADESYAEAGARELREETGLDPASVTVLQEYWVATGVLRHRRAIVYAEDFTAVEPDRDGNEFLTIRRIPVADALATARSEPANDATISGLLIAAADRNLPIGE